MYLRPYKPGPIEPVARPGENVVLIDREGYNLYVVAYIEPIPISGPLIVNAGAVAALTTLATTNPQLTLDMSYGQLSQLRAHVLDDIIVAMLQPGGVARHALKTPVATINAFTALRFPNDEPSEVFIFEDQRVFLQVTNPRPVALAQSRVEFYGIKYVLAGRGGTSTGGAHLTPLGSFTSIEAVEKNVANYTAIPTGAWGR